MSCTNKIIRLSTKTFLLSLGLTLVACGGGGGGSSPTGIVYTGSTDPADVDNTNTQTYSAAIMDGSQDSQENLNNFGITAITTDGGVNQNKQHAMLSAFVQQVKTDIENNNFGGTNLISGATQTITGDCLGKEGTITISSAQTSTSVTVSMTYSSYCTEFVGTTTTISGSLTAVVALSGSSITSMNITIPHIVMTTANGTTTYTNEFSGSIAVAFTAGGELENMTISVNFTENGKVYKITSMSYATSNSNITISGTIYHPDYGYVTFTATEPFALYNDQLCGGTLTVTGVNSNFTITADATCESYTYSGTNNLGNLFSGSFTSL